MTKQMAVITMILVGAAYIGWHGRGLHEDSKALVALEVTTALNDEARARESAIAKVVESKLSNLTASETIIDRGIIREIEKPIYSNVCLDDNAIRLLNAAAEGSSADSAKPTDSLP